jgi:tetratricopeptide (TPR) repeat protein
MMVDLVDNLTAGLYLNMGRLSEAEQLGRRNIASLEKKLTPLDESMLNARLLRGRVLLEQERLPEAVAQLEQVLDLVKSKHDDEATITSAAMIALGNAYLASGDIARAERIVDEAVPFMEKRAPNSSRHAAILLLQGRLQTLRGRFEPAAAAFAAARTMREHETAFKSDGLAKVIVGQTDLALARGDYTAAAQRLGEAQAALARPAPWFDYVADLVASRRAMSDHAQGRDADALAAAQATLNLQQRRTEPNANTALQAELEITIGRALTGLSRPREALSHLQNALKIREAAGNPNSFWLADVYVRRAECERALGNQDAARALLAKAMSIYAIQGQLGDFVTKPLRDAQLLAGR